MEALVFFLLEEKPSIFHMRFLFKLLFYRSEWRPRVDLLFSVLTYCLMRPIDYEVLLAFSRGATNGRSLLLFCFE